MPASPAKVRVAEALADGSKVFTAVASGVVGASVRVATIAWGRNIRRSSSLTRADATKATAPPSPSKGACSPAGRYRMLAYLRRRKDVAVVGGLVAFFFLVVIPLVSGGGGATDGEGALRGSGWRWVTIVDAGSSGCRAHVFRWRTGRSGVVEVDPTHNNLKVKPGLSSFKDDPGAAGASLAPLLDFVRSEIPEGEWASSPIFLKATAGLRMTPAGPREQILESVRDALSASPLKFDDREAGALVIEGTDEGGFGWMSVNYLMGNLDGHAKHGDFVGVVEMGGASAQVTQIRDSAKPQPGGYSFDFKVGKQPFHLYTHSYLGYGLEQARETLSAHLVERARGGRVKDPCLNAGFEKEAAEPRIDVYDGPSAVDLRGVAGDHAECARAVEKSLFSRDDPCGFESCSFNGIFQPPNLPKGKLLAFENFHYTAQMLGVGQPDTSAADFKAAARDACAAEWTAFQASPYPKDGSEKFELNKLCFSATYLALFLEKGVGVDARAKIKVQQQVGDHGIDWSLGAAIKEATKIAHGH